MSQVESKEKQAVDSFQKLPPWFRQEIPDQKAVMKMKGLLKESSLHTVCEKAHCPNMGECFKSGTATFMILGGVCTRECRFCAVEKGESFAVNDNEPQDVANAVKALALKYVVITSVTRDDLSDGGANHFAQTVEAIRRIMPSTKIELLVPDFQNVFESLEAVVKSKPFVVGHNIETVEKVFSLVRPYADFDKSLSVLKNIKVIDDSILTKSGFMVGLGESKSDVISLLERLKDVDCDIITIGQYLAPSTSGRHVKVSRFVDLNEFKEYELIAREIGFKFVVSGPLVRSSYKAHEVFNV